ncbi:MAG: glycosyl hydrolase family 28 protein [Oscillospiraceae bacterium]|nr:glycosyl hydrolase family 28 protein [Oscillospiraceae bacterium]
MKKCLSAVLAFTVIALHLTAWGYCKGSVKFEPLEYPSEAVCEFVPEKLNRASSKLDFDANSGYDETGIYISPYWNCFVNSEEISAYSALTYDYALDRGVLQSFACIWADLSGGELKIDLLTDALSVKDAVVLPESSEIKCDFSDKRVTFTVSDYGIYTCLVNNASQEYAFTLFVREYTDEEKAIEEYKNKFGEQNVLVFEKGYYETEKIDGDGYKVVYFCRGSYFSAKHIYDIPDEEAFSALPAREAFISLYGKSGVIISGGGTFDFTALDRKERDPVIIANCTDCTAEGLIFINSDHWTLNVSASSDIRINDIAAVAYRANSDGINVCGSENVSVTNSFMRNGDDSFSVKTMEPGRKAHDISFENCVAWSTKARCFGITGEVEDDIYNVTFKNCSVVCRNAVWDNDRIASLAITVENGKGNIENIKFENIEIFSDAGRAINCVVYGKEVKDCKIRNIVFKDISYNSNMKSQVCSDCNLNFCGRINAFLYRFLTKLGLDGKLTDKLSEKIGNNSVEFTFSNVRANGHLITEKNSCRFVSATGVTQCSFE